MSNCMYIIVPINHQELQLNCISSASMSSKFIKIKDFYSLTNTNYYNEIEKKYPYKDLLHFIRFTPKNFKGKNILIFLKV